MLFNAVYDLAVFTQSRRRRRRDLGFNQLNGTLPPSWSTMQYLGSLTIEGNGISGPLPASWSSMTSMTSL
jgi:hypothetical protein